MARPRVPLIARETAVAAALRIIDREGLKGLNIRAMGAELGVHGSSLYHHFENKEALEAAVAEWVLDTGRLPMHPTTDWRASVLDAVDAYWAGLNRHPNALPLLTKPDMRIRANVPYLESLLDATRADGIADETIAALMVTVTGLAVGFAVRNQATKEDDDEFWSNLLPPGIDQYTILISACSTLIETVGAGGFVLDAPPERARTKKRRSLAGRSAGR